MKLIKRHGILKSRPRVWRPYRIILHHTAGGTMRGAVSTLINRGLAYHYMIDKNGDVHEFVPPNKMAYHAYKNNLGTVGISFIGGGKFGPANAEQLKACMQLCKIIKEDYPSVTEITGHKHVDPRGWKVDPHFEGEPENGVNWDIDKKFMTAIAKETGLTFVNKGYLQGKGKY